MQWHQVEHVPEDEVERLVSQEGLEPPEPLADGAEITQPEVCSPPTAPPPAAYPAAPSASQAHSPATPLLPSVAGTPHVSPSGSASAPTVALSPHTYSSTSSSPGRQGQGYPQMSPLGGHSTSPVPLPLPGPLPALVGPTRTLILSHSPLHAGSSGPAAARSPAEHTSTCSAQHTPMLPASPQTLSGRVITPRMGVGVAAAAVGIDMGSSPSKVAIHDIATSLAKSAAEIGMVYLPLASLSF